MYKSQIIDEGIHSDKDFLAKNSQARVSPVKKSF